ncbi:MAG TPA: bifunctional serine/threonine-protein kinase/formylglycine-generating enzyme family protein [Steroidobacteraceae bacterium]|nr:bifunctional serine/threonine-protein kinase/formylglycine-generating enzyme family protein [Steroidobacteraceae bacterium]
MAPKDKTLLRSRDAALAFILGETAAVEKTEVLRDPAGIAQAAMSQPPAFLKTLVSRFGLVELAGEGGMSRVYKAVDLRMVEAGTDDPHVAVKVLNIPFENVNDAMALLHREMRHLQDLVHPNIVRVFDCNRDGDTVFMTMEFLAGRTLTSQVRAQGFAGVDEAIALPVIRSIAAALEFAHGKRVVHGDLTPGNVMLADSGVVKVIDFGIARIIADPVGTFMGRASARADAITGVTPAYASPQQIENRGVDFRDDVYSLGCIVWELLTGSHPFNRKQSTLARDAGDKLERHARLTTRQYRALAHALQFDRAARTPSVRQFMDELTGERRRRQMKIAAAAAVAVVGAVAAFSFLRAPQTVTVPQPVPVAATPEPAPPPELAVGTVFRDCPTCPLMIVLPPGDYVQGTPAGTPGTESFESPQHDVFIDNSFAASQHEVTVGEFEEFVAATGRKVEGCWTYDGAWRLDAAVSWKSAVEGQTALHPASCVSWDDANAYAQWLSQRTHQPYRLPSAAEWEFAARGGSSAAQPWTSDANACSQANVADQTASQRFPGWRTHACMDTYVQSAPVGSFAANAFGLHDMLGNVFEWVADCWHDDYSGAPDDGTARMDGDCSQHEMRGGSWFTAPDFVRVSYRNRFATDYRSSSVGFRVVRRTAR